MNPNAAHRAQTPNQSTPPGWYTDPTTGRQRYWNGLEWQQEGQPQTAPGLHGVHSGTPVAYDARFREPTAAQQAGRVVANTAIGIWNVFAVLTWIIAAVGILGLIFS